MEKVTDSFNSIILSHFPSPTADFHEIDEIEDDPVQREEGEPLTNTTKAIHHTQEHLVYLVLQELTNISSMKRQRQGEIKIQKNEANSRRQSDVCGFSGASERDSGITNWVAENNISL